MKCFFIASFYQLWKYYPITNSMSFWRIIWVKNEQLELLPSFCPIVKGFKFKSCTGLVRRHLCVPSKWRTSFEFIQCKPIAPGYRREPFTGQACLTLIFLWSLMRRMYTAELWNISWQHKWCCNVAKTRWSGFMQWGWMILHLCWTEGFSA